MNANRVGFFSLISFIIITFISNPLRAMEGKVDNLNVDDSCTSVQKTAVVDAFRSANLLVRYSLWAVEVRRMIAKDEKFEKSSKFNYNYDKYTGLKFDHDLIVDYYGKVFGPFDDAIAEQVSYKYGVVSPIPLPVDAACEPADSTICDDAVAFVYPGSTSSGNYAKFGFCPKFFEISLPEVKKFTLYKSASEIQLYQAGVIVHELMHTNFINSQTGHDMKYRYENVLNLSKAPGLAAENPDSYHVFSILAYGYSEAPKCVLVTDRGCNCGSGMTCR